MTILFLHGLSSTAGGIKPTYLKDHGHTVLNPALPDEVFDEAIRIAQAEFDRHHPDVVARTKRIPVEQRAEAAVIAWMRHQTTAYDSMIVPRIKGKRREVRRMLAQRSVELMGRYRRGEAVGGECPLERALANDCGHVSDHHRKLWRVPCET